VLRSPEELCRWPACSSSPPACRGQLRFHAEHVVERYRLFTIIVLGEAILAATLAANDAIDVRGLSFEVLALTALAVVGLVVWKVAQHGAPGFVTPEGAAVDG